MVPKSTNPRGAILVFVVLDTPSDRIVVVLSNPSIHGACCVDCYRRLCRPTANQTSASPRGYYNIERSYKENALVRLS